MEGKAKAYGHESLYKVQAVAVIPPLKKVSSEEKNHQPKQDLSDAPARKFFPGILDEMCEKERQKDIHVCTNGYTKRALPYYNLISKREYCYPT